MEIIKEIEHINCSNSSLTNFFSDINNYKEVFSNEVSSFEILNENVFEIKIGSFPKISLTHSKSNKNSISLKSASQSNSSPLSLITTCSWPSSTSLHLADSNVQPSPSNQMRFARGLTLSTLYLADTRVFA